MSGKVLSPDEVAELIKTGKPLSLGGSAELLSQLPAGNWIGGSIPYFMGANGGEHSPDKIFATELSADAIGATIKLYDCDDIKNVYLEAPDNGFSLIILPALSEVHVSFATNAPNYEGFATSPLVGWIAGSSLEVFEPGIARVFDGNDPKGHANKAAVLHLSLPASKVAELSIVNIFEPGAGAVIQFEETSWDQTTAIVDGKKVNLAEYFADNEIDTKLPLVADSFGATINSSIISSDKETGSTKFYAPMFRGVDYRVAKPVANYVEAFATAMPPETADATFLCNCILNYVYGELDGKQTGEATGPITFGEIAYQLLNQTVAYLTVRDV